MRLALGHWPWRSGNGHDLAEARTGYSGEMVYHWEAKHTAFCANQGIQAGACFPAFCRASCVEVRF